MPPEKLGRYEIVRELGHGAMGVVYEALDPTIGRRVALKAIRFDGLGTTADEAARRFKNEARAAGGLNHPNLVTVYDAGEDGGNLYLAMEFIEGSNLDELLRAQRTLSPEKTIDIIRQVCAGLDFAHNKGIVHRDVKPANVMLGANSTVKITDFGIARAGEAMTLTGQVIGTPHYMSPEQVVGKNLDGRSDLFSVGVMLYEMITGERPFEGQSITTVMYKIVHETPIPPRKLDATIHPGLSAVIEKSLAKAPEERFQTGAELTKALEDYRMAAVSAPSILDLPTAQFPVPEIAKQQQPGTAAQSLSSTVPATNQTPPVRWLAAFSAIDPKRRKRIVAVVVILGAWLWSHFRRQENHVTIKDDHEQVTTSNPPAPSPPAATPATSAQQAQPDPESRTPELTEQQNAGESKTTALLKVNSNPPSAEIQIDGKPTGKTTPAELHLPRGQHSVSVRMSGFQPSSASFRVKGGEEIEYSPQLVVAMPNVAMPNIPMPDLSRLGDLSKQGAQQTEFWQKWAQQYSAQPKLVITSSPLGARVVIDGKDSGQTTPAVIDTEPGTYHVKLELDGFKAAERDLTVQAQKPGVWKATLKSARSEQ